MIRVKCINNFLLIHASFVMLSHVFSIILHHFYAFCQINLFTRCLVPIFCFCCFCIPENLLLENSRNWTKIYGEFLFDGRHQDTKGQPGGPPTGQGSPPAAALGQPAGGTRPCPMGTPSAPTDAYKISLNLETSAIIFHRSHRDAPSP